MSEGRCLIDRLFYLCPKCGHGGLTSLRLVHVVSQSFQPDHVSEFPLIAVNAFPKNESERFIRMSREMIQRQCGTCGHVIDVLNTVDSGILS